MSDSAEFDAGRDGYAIVLCRCEPCPYIGARKAGTPDRCEVCGFMTPDQYDAIKASVARELADRVLSECHEQAHAEVCRTQYMSDRTSAHVAIDVVADWLRSTRIFPPRKGEPA